MSFANQSGFERVLRRYQEGDCTDVDVIAEVDRVLKEDLYSADAVLQTLTDVTGSNETGLRDLVRSRVVHTISLLGDGSSERPSGEESQTPVGDDQTRIYTDGPELLRPGDEIGPLQEDGSRRFVLLESLGSGGMSVVFKAKDKGSYGQPTIALKVLNSNFSKHPDALVAIQRETAKARELIECPNIVNVYDGGVDGAHAYMWMDFLEGLSLRDRLRTRALSSMSNKEAMLIIEGMATGLSFAHKANIIHADFKPGNVMLSANPVTSTDQVKIIDFGIARAFRRPNAPVGEATIFDPGKLKALTPEYASPEMLDQLDPDPRDDVYALACIAYEILTGRHPFERMRATEARDNGLSLEQRRGVTPRQYRAIRKALLFTRAERTPTADQFLREFMGSSSKTIKNLERVALVLIMTFVLGFVIWNQRDMFSVIEVGEQFSDCWFSCPTMVLLPGGSFSQGSSLSGSFANERPIRTVAFEQPFALGIHEVSVDEYAQFVEDDGSIPSGCLVYDESGWHTDPAANWLNPGFEQAGTHPVTCVSWEDASAYVRWLGQATGHSYRLQSASEFEFAAQYTANQTDLCSVANLADESATDRYPGWKAASCIDGFVHTAPVGELGESPDGVTDLLGNVFEWVADCWHDDYTYAPTDGEAWLSGNCDTRGVRGGSWHTRPDLVRPAFRNRLPATTRVSTVGFRVARDVNTKDVDAGDVEENEYDE